MITSFRHPGCVLQVLPTLIQIQNSLQLSSCLIYSPVKFSFKSRGKEWLRWGAFCTGQNKVSLEWSPKHGSPVVPCSMAGMWCGQEIPELLQVRFHTWHNPGIPAQNPRSAGTKDWGEPPTRDQHQPIQGIPKLCLLISYSPASFIFPSDAHWSKELQNPQISVTRNYSCLKATALVISEDLWKCHLCLWLLRWKTPLV